MTSRVVWQQSSTSDVTKLFKIRIRRMQISTSKIRRIRMRMRMLPDKGLFFSLGMQHTGLCQLNGCDSIQISTCLLYTSPSPRDS